ncbi:hypothetical protein PoB_004630000 [Plakobranchus ocellatus]|uniref:Uncharacterized protein n=1 Tax=Plakobranchus ocellatus TaxID=259542 RepID=A0AAV4BGZ9_9GAST|nr:hypothetical protein PoB_004630000 [Plakobranchus ocellatus]
MRLGSGEITFASNAHRGLRLGEGLDDTKIVLWSFCRQDVSPQSPVERREWRVQVCLNVVQVEIQYPGSVDHAPAVDPRAKRNRQPRGETVTSLYRVCTALSRLARR